MFILALFFIAGWCGETLTNQAAAPRAQELQRGDLVHVGTDKLPVVKVESRMSTLSGPELRPVGALRGMELPRKTSHLRQSHRWLLAMCQMS